MRSFLTRISSPFILLAIVVFSFFLSLKAGERGFFAFDQSIVFDGSYRILCGQVPYKDFIMPIGPMVFWLQAVFFKLFGTNYFSYLAGAASANVLAVICSLIITRLLFPSHKFLSYIAGLLTAIWFYPPFGTPWAEQTAFLFSFLGVTFVLAARHYRKFSLLLLSGCFALLSLLSKQNAGLFILPLYFILLFTCYAPEFKLVLRGCFMLLAGFTASGLLFFLWLWAKSDLKIFFQYFFQIPSLLGAYRLLEEKADLLTIFFGGSCHHNPLHGLPLGIRLIFSFIFLSAVFVSVYYLRNYKKIKDSWRTEFLASVLCIYLIFFQYLFIHTTMNEAKNGIPFTGLIFAIGLGLLLRLSNNRGMAKIRPLALISASLLVSFLCLAGIRVSFAREIQQFRGAKFPKYLSIDKLKALKWGQPTIVGGEDVKEEDMVNLVNYLRAEKKNFFIFPNFTFLYAVLGVPSPQPVLWFHKGLTYHVLYDPELDKWIVGDLIKNKVEIVVIEEKPVCGTLDDLWRMKAYIDNNFIKTQKFGIFNIYQRIAAR